MGDCRQARTLDQAMERVWARHPVIVRLGNDDGEGGGHGFEAKVARAVAAARAVVGVDA